MIDFISVKERRQSLELYQKDVAELAGVSANTVWRLERGKKVRYSTSFLYLTSARKCAILTIEDDLASQII